MRGDTSRLEAAARSLWEAWGDYRRHTFCEGPCGTLRYCHAARPRGRFLCLECFDLSPEADRFLERR